ncbi:MAG: GH3 auxin-responsive promoter family protein [Phycisphaerae bacterium]|nr:GH3 auxin-responsive promoter family protein [Phycisphaerae bacterium]
MGRLLKTATWIKGGLIQRSFDRATRDPQSAQAGLLAHILKKNQGTQYGKQYGFSQITTPGLFATTIPINTFPDLSAYVERMKRGERNILTSDQPVLFNLTSGTTDKPKYVPVTQEGMALTANGSRQWLYRALKDHPSFLDHSIVCVSGSAIEGKTKAGIPYGSASGMMYESLPRVLHRSFALPFLLSKIKDYELRYYVMARVALEHEASFVVTPNPTTLVRLAETGIQYQEDIIRSIRDGVLSCTSCLKTTPEDARILDAIRVCLRPNPLRANGLESVIQQHDRLIPAACWKELKLIGCWLGGSIGFQADKLETYFGQDVPKRDIGYLASEGCMTIPYEDNTAAGILALHNNYYEFIPVDQSATTHERSRQCHELEEGKQYKILLTNGNGLYRYDIHDIIEVCGFYHRTPVIAFVRKGDDMLNITGEKLHVNHFTEVFKTLKRTCDLSVTQFRVVPNHRDLRYEILISLESEVSHEFLRETVLSHIDRSLSEGNIEYEAKRRSRRLNPPCIHMMDERWIDDVRDRFIESGHRDIQYKWRAIAAEMSNVDARHILYTIDRAFLNT